MNYDSNKNQEIKRKFVDRDVIYCQSSLIDGLLKLDFRTDDSIDISYDDIENLYYTDEQLKDMGYDNPDDARDNGEDIQEIFEWWLVTNWLADEWFLGQPNPLAYVETYTVVVDDHGHLNLPCPAFWVEDAYDETIMEPIPHWDGTTVGFDGWRIQKKNPDHRWRYSAGRWAAVCDLCRKLIQECAPQNQRNNPCRIGHHCHHSQATRHTIQQFFHCNVGSAYYFLIRIVYVDLFPQQGRKRQRLRVSIGMVPKKQKTKVG